MTVPIDNAVDILMPGNEVATRAPIDFGTLEPDRPKLLAEHGLSLLLTVEREGERSSLLYDAGLGAGTAVHNMDVATAPRRPAGRRPVARAHRPSRRSGGDAAPRRRARDAARDPSGRLAGPQGGVPPGAEIHLPPPSCQDLDREGVEVGEERNPSLLIDGTVLVTGEIERVNAFERGLPGNQALTEAAGSRTPGSGTTRPSWPTSGAAGWSCSGCSHAGAINVLRQAQRLTGEERVHAFVGGMHLTGPAFEPLIPPTLDELEAIGPDWVVPGHCTGWRAQHELARRMPDAYVQTSVGTRLALLLRPGG